MTALPPSLSAALPGIQWSLSELAPPLHFQSLEQLQSIRKKPAAVNSELFHDVAGTVESLVVDGDNTSEKQQQRHFGLISCALILLGHGYTDECHDLITPISWPEDLHFGHGPSVYAVASPACQRDMIVVPNSL